VTPLRVTLVTETYPPEVNGVAITLGHLVRGLGERGHRVTVVRPRPVAGGPGGDGEVRVPGLPLPRYPLLRFGLPAGGRLRRAWRRVRPDVVHVATEGPLGWSALRTARRLGIPVTSSFHTNFHLYVEAYRAAWLRGVATRWLRHVHNRTLRTFVPTPELARDLAAEGYVGLRHLPRGVDTDVFAPARRDEDLRRSWGAGPDDPVVIHTSRLAPEKNFPLLLRAHAAMRALDPRCRLVLAGDGPLRPRLERENPGVVFTGFLSREETGRHCASADVYLHASTTETYGNVVAEALASGLAFVGFDYAAARHLVRSGEGGLLVRRGDDAAFVEAAVGLLAAPEETRRLRSAARRAVEGLSWAGVVERWAADLADVVRSSRDVREALIARPRSPRRVRAPLDSTEARP
jgi:glycosyltransferase involved in cell wall biosynthesis